MIHEPALAMRTNMFTGRLAQTVHAYPHLAAGHSAGGRPFFGQFGGRTARPAEPGRSEPGARGTSCLPHHAAHRAGAGTSGRRLSETDNSGDHRGLA